MALALVLWGFVGGAQVCAQVACRLQRAPHLRLVPDQELILEHIFREYVLEVQLLNCGFQFIEVCADDCVPVLLVDLVYPILILDLHDFALDCLDLLPQG